MKRKYSGEREWLYYFTKDEYGKIGGNVMSSSNILRLAGGISSFTSGILLFLAHFINMSGKTEYGTVLGNSLVFIAHILLVFAFIGLYHAQGEGNSLLGILSMLMGVLGTILVSAIVLVEIAGSSGVNVVPIFESAIPNMVRTIGSIMFVLGMLLFGTSIAKNKKLPFWGGISLIIGTIVFAVRSVAGEAEPLITVIGAAITGAGFIGIGLPVFTRKYPH